MQDGIIKSGLIINRTVPILLLIGTLANAEVVGKRLSDYSIVEERNIFTPPKVSSPVSTPSVTPVPEVKPKIKEEVAKKVTEVEGMILTGIVFFDNKFHALLEEKAASKGAILASGEVINGVTIVDIEEGKVLLQSKGDRLEMALERESKETGFPPMGIGIPPVDFGRTRPVPGTRGRKRETGTPTSTPTPPVSPPTYPGSYQDMPYSPEGIPSGIIPPEEAQ